MRKTAVGKIIATDDGPNAGPRGFSLVELLVATAVGLVVLSAMYGIFTIQNKTFGGQEEILAMQQRIRAGMDMMAREVAMAGYDPAGVNTDANSANNFSGITVDAAQLQIKADINGDGDTGDSDETIVYKYVNTTSNPYRIMRQSGGGDFVSFVENVESFAFEYLDRDGNATTLSADVRQIRITITGRTANPDPAYSANGGYRTYTLKSVVTPRNLAF
jgi:type IV pilus assembly protein PilW